MPESTIGRRPEPRPAGTGDQVLDRVREVRAGLTTLLWEAEQARLRRSEVGAARDGSGPVCAWNHFENIPTFYNWNNRPR